MYGNGTLWFDGTRTEVRCLPKAIRFNRPSPDSQAGLCFWRGRRPSIVGVCLRAFDTGGQVVVRNRAGAPPRDRDHIGIAKVWI